jgi:ribonuclease-3
MIAAANKEALIRALGHTFVQPKLLQEALVHPSYRNERGGKMDNQRLEFLGDAVLGLVITEALLEALPERREGQLTALKSQLVRESSLAQVAEELRLGSVLQLGRGEDRTGGRQRPSVLADAVEALIGAVFLDGGYEPARTLVRRLLQTRLAELVGDLSATAPSTPALAARMGNWKTAVQELLQHLGLLPPVYELVGHNEHLPARRFTVQALVTGRETWQGQGSGASKKVAEYAAAEQLFRQILADTTDLDAGWYAAAAHLATPAVESLPDDPLADL